MISSGLHRHQSASTSQMISPASCYSTLSDRLNVVVLDFPASCGFISDIPVHVVREDLERLRTRQPRVTPSDKMPPHSHMLLAFAVEQEHSGCPDRIKALEPCRMFLNVSFTGRKFWSMNCKQDDLTEDRDAVLSRVRKNVLPRTTIAVPSCLRLPAPRTALSGLHLVRMGSTEGRYEAIIWSEQAPVWQFDSRGWLLLLIKIAES